MPLALLFPLTCIVIWAGNGVVSKLAVGIMSPAALAWSRWLVAAVILTPFLARSLYNVRAHVIRVAPKLLALALLGMVLSQSMGYTAAQTLSATEMGLMMGLTPLLTVLLSMWLLGESPTKGAVSGGALSLLGLLILLGQGNPLGLLTHGINIGSFYMLLAASSYALYGVLLKRWQLGLSTWQLLYAQVLFSVLLLTPYFFFVDGHLIDRRALWLVLYAGVPTSVLSPWLWMQAIQLLGANRTSIFMNLLPLMTALLAVGLLGETLTPYHLLGGGLTLIGVLLTQLWVAPLLRKKLSEAEAATAASGF
ncbi:MAG: DMT family transporter [Aeromonas sp.]